MNTDTLYDIGLVLLPIVAVPIFTWSWLYSIKIYRKALLEERRSRLRQNAEHGLVVSTALLLLVIANVIIGIGFLVQDAFATETVALFIRVELIITGLYLVLRHPSPPS